MKNGHWKILLATAIVTAASTSATLSASESEMMREYTDIITGTVPLVPMATACGVDLLESDLRNDKSSDPMACWTKCIVSRDCNAVTWTNHEGGTCWYKRWDSLWGYPRTTPKTGAISYFEYHNDGFPATMTLSEHNSTDMPGYDIGNAPEKNERACIDRCSDWNGCFAVTWSPYQGGTCWFKSMVSNTVDNGGLFSYAILRRNKWKCQ